MIAVLAGTKQLADRFIRELSIAKPELDLGKIKGWMYVHRDEQLDGLRGVDVVLLDGYWLNISGQRIEILRMDIKSKRLRDKTDEYIQSLRW